jgi:hypothetical protein
MTGSHWTWILSLRIWGRLSRQNRRYMGKRRRIQTSPECSNTTKQTRRVNKYTRLRFQLIQAIYILPVSLEYSVASDVQVAVRRSLRKTSQLNASRNISWRNYHKTNTISGTREGQTSSIRHEGEIFHICGCERKREGVVMVFKVAVDC